MSGVPSKDYRRQYAALMPELLPLLERTLLEEDPVLGGPLERFERDFADYLGARHAVGVGTGTDALVLALRALGVGPGDEVVTAANTFIATVTAILTVSARPVLVDPDPATMNVDAEGVRGALTERTKAVIPVHLYGRAAPMAAIGAVCAEAGVTVVEDAAQAHGARTDVEGRAGACGALGCFSFHPSKNLGAFGDGGLIALDDDDLADELRARRDLGKVGKHAVRYVGANSKLDTLQAALLGLKLPHLDEWNERRRAIAARYREALAGIGDLKLPDDPGGGRHVFHLFVVRTPGRDALRAFLKERGVKASLHYPIPPHLQDLADADLGYAAGDFPVAEEFARTVLSLPVAPELTDEEIGRVCAEVRSFFGAPA